MYIYFSCMRFTLPRSSNNTSQIRTIMLFINNRFIASHSSKALFSKEKLNMQQGQACIPLVRFPDPNYGIKNGKFYNKLPSLIMSSPSVPLCVTQRSFLFTLVRPKRKSLYSKLKEIQYRFQKQGQ